MSILGTFHDAIRAVQPLETAIGAVVLEIMAIVYVSTSRIQRPRRVPMVMSASLSLAFTVIVFVCLDGFYAAPSDYPMPTVAVALSIAAFVATAFLSLYAIVGAWAKIDGYYRTMLILGGLTLIGATLSVAAACFGHTLMYETSPEIVFNYIRVNSRDVAVLAGIGFISLGFGLTVAGRSATKSANSRARG